MISLAQVAQLLGGDETLPGAVERGDALEYAVRAGQGGGCRRPVPSSTAGSRWRWRRASWVSGASRPCSGRSPTGSPHKAPAA